MAHLEPTDRSAAGRSYDLADHFLDCSKLGRYLTVPNGSRFVVTDDVRRAPILPAAAVAAIYSQDILVAQAALLPLGDPMRAMDARRRDRYERLFALIEEQALSDEVRGSAEALITARFRAAEVRALAAELTGKLDPGRRRYRAFLGIVKQVMDGGISERAFLDEFRQFTGDVAGKLDFGIYSFCLDRIFQSPLVPVKVKQVLILEIINYPPTVRRELLANVLSDPGQSAEVTHFAELKIRSELGEQTSIEIDLLKSLRLRRLSVGDIERSMAAR